MKCASSFNKRRVQLQLNRSNPGRLIDHRLQKPRSRRVHGECLRKSNSIRKIRRTSQKTHSLLKSTKCPKTVSLNVKTRRLRTYFTMTRAVRKRSKPILSDSNNRSSSQLISKSPISTSFPNFKSNSRSQSKWTDMLTKKRTAKK